MAASVFVQMSVSGLRSVISVDKCCRSHKGSHDPRKCCRSHKGSHDPHTRIGEECHAPIKVGSTVQVGPSAGWGPLLSSAIQELSVARHLSCSVSGLARFSLPQAPSRPRPAPSLQWAHQSNLGRTSTQRHPPLEPDGANPFCATAVPPRGWSVRAVPTRPGQQSRIDGHEKIAAHSFAQPGQKRRSARGPCEKKGLGNRCVRSKQDAAMCSNTRALPPVPESSYRTFWALARRLRRASFPQPALFAQIAACCLDSGAAASSQDSP